MSYISFILRVVIYIVLLVISLVGFYKGQYDANKKGHKRFTKQGWLITLGMVAMVALGVWSEIENKLQGDAHKLELGKLKQKMENYAFHSNIAIFGDHIYDTILSPTTYYIDARIANTGIRPATNIRIFTSCMLVKNNAILARHTDTSYRKQFMYNNQISHIEFYFPYGDKDATVYLMFRAAWSSEGSDTTISQVSCFRKAPHGREWMGVELSSNINLQRFYDSSSIMKISL